MSLIKEYAWENSNNTLYILTISFLSIIKLTSTAKNQLHKEIFFIPYSPKNISSYLSYNNVSQVFLSKEQMFLIKIRKIFRLYLFFLAHTFMHIRSIKFIRETFFYTKIYVQVNSRISRSYFKMENVILICTGLWELSDRSNILIGHPVSGKRLFAIAQKNVYWLHIILIQLLLLFNLTCQYSRISEYWRWGITYPYKSRNHEHPPPFVKPLSRQVGNSAKGTHLSTLPHTMLETFGQRHI